jgi:hypothetical protein
MQTTVDPATVKTRLDDNDRRLIARTRQGPADRELPVSGRQRPRRPHPVLVTGAS